jgi:hypothetical protein
MARKKRKLTTPTPKVHSKSWAVAGIDVSMTSISGAMLCYDALLDDIRGPGVHSVRWERDVHFLDRLGSAVRGPDFIHALMAACGPMTIPMENVWIGVEEPWPAGIVRKAESGWLRQQAQVQGAFLGGLSRYGYRNVYEVNSQVWKNPIRAELDQGKIDKWDVKAWAMSAFDLPDLPDLIDHSTRGLIPRPENSKAKARQPDDIYDAAGILAWMQDTREMEGAT